jgi:hypothetical protein
MLRNVVAASDPGLNRVFHRRKMLSKPPYKVKAEFPQRRPQWLAVPRHGVEA